MNIYNKARVLRNQYKEDIDYDVKLSIITQILSVMFANNDHLPKIITLKLDCRIILKMHRPLWLEGFKFYPYDVISQVLSDLELDLFNFNHYCHSSAFTYIVEVNFFQQLTESH